MLLCGLVSESEMNHVHIDAVRLTTVWAEVSFGIVEKDELDGVYD